jgi:hypothetical protein
MDTNWQAFGIVLAVLVFSAVVAFLTRLMATHKIQGQTFAMVVLGVSGVVTLTGFRVGWDVVGFQAACFAVAALPMGIEYYSRLIAEQKKANEEAEKLLNGNSSTNR